MSRNFIVIEGSKKFFDETVNYLCNNSNYPSDFSRIIETIDAFKKNGLIFDEPVDVLAIKNISYHGINNEAHYGIGEIIETITTDNAIVYIHNPTLILWNYLNFSNYVKDEDNYFCEKYLIKTEDEDFKNNVNILANKVVGQQEALQEILKSIWYLSKSSRKKPYVIMLYGGSSLGKTETVREIARMFFENKFFEKYLSMFMNNTYTDYFFGDRPNSKSLAFDLYERESNLIFFDEFDKCSNIFYSAFYTLFDNVTFMDNSYKVDVSSTIIILTSNFHSEEEMKVALGLPIYYRIDKFINYQPLDIQSILQITKNEIENRKDEFIDICSVDEFYSLVSRKIKVENENGRTIKKKVQETIEDLIFTKSFGKYFK